MKKIYSIVIILLAILIIISNYSYAGIARSNDSSLSLESASSDSSNDAESNSGLPESNNGGFNNIPSANNNLLISLNDSYIDRFPKAYIVMISPNPAYEYGITNFIGWVKDPAEQKVSFEWDFGDGRIYREDGNGSFIWCNTSHRYTSVGEYIVNLSIIKDGKVISTDSKPIKVISLPVFGGAGGPYFGLVGEKIVFRGLSSSYTSISLSLVSGTNISISFDWDFGDGTTASGQIVSHIYDKVGVYTATLTVTDERGAISSYSTSVTVGKINVRIQPSNPSVGEEVNFGVAVTGFSPTRYYWDFGDKSNIGLGQSVTHTYTKPGTYYGRISFNKELCNLYYDFIIVLVSYKDQVNQKPISYFKVSPSSGEISTVFEFDASASVDNDGKIALYEWYFGNGDMIITKNAKYNYVFNEEGEWSVKCVVIDDKGDYGSYQKIVKVTNNDQQSSNLNIELNNRRDVIFYDGKLKEIQNEIFNDVIPIIDVCNLKISVSTESEILDIEKPLKIDVKVSDSLKSYDLDNINIQLLSDIPGYKIVSYTAKRNPKTQDYQLSIEIPLSEDAKSHTIVIVANPNVGFAQKDSSANRWSNTISIKCDETSEIYSPINYTQSYGSLSM